MAVLKSIAPTDLSESGVFVPIDSAAMERRPSQTSNTPNHKRQHEGSGLLAHNKVMRGEAVNLGRDIANCPVSSGNVRDMNTTNIAGSALRVTLPICPPKMASSKQCLVDAHPQ